MLLEGSGETVSSSSGFGRSRLLNDLGAF